MQTLTTKQYTNRAILTIWAVVIACCSFAASANDEGETLVINELMQSNVDCVMDDLNEFPDSWIELYNPTTTTIKLKDYKIGKKEKAEKAWQLPDKTVGAKQRILVYCDKESKDLHTDFRLETTKASSVFLFKDNAVVDQVTFSEQPAPNIAYGRKTDGDSEWGYQLTPTPNKANTGEICGGDHLLGNPVFSQEGVVLANGGEIRITLSLPTDAPQGTMIRYTLDGKEPTSSSTAYGGTFVFNSNKVLRAKLFCKGWLSPCSTCHSYIFFPTNRELTLPIISITTDNKYLDDSKIGIYANNNNNKSVNWRRPINIEMFETANQMSVINQLVETRVMGQASRSASLKSLAVYANKRFGTSHFTYEFFPDQKPGLNDFKSILLRNAGNDFDYLYMRDAIVQRTMASHTDLDWQAWRPAIFYVNGQYKGMLNIRERSNEDYIYTNYDGLEDVDVIENWSSVNEGDKDNFNRFKEFYGEQGHTMEEFEQWMDCREFINLMIMNLYFNNLDFPGNNSLMWRPRNDGDDTSQTQGRWRWIAKDCDYTMGIYGDPVTYKILEWLYNPNYDGRHNWGANGSEGTRLFKQLMDDKDFKREFIDRTCIYMGDFLNEKGTRAVWDPMYETIKTEYPYHRKLINQWWPNYDQELSNARKWLRQRTAEYYKQLGNYYKLGSPIPMTVNKDFMNAYQTTIMFNDIPLSENVFDGCFFANRNISITANAPEGQIVKGWKVKTTLTSGSVQTKEVAGSQLTMTMPSCKALSIESILGQDTGIRSVSSRQWQWQRTAEGIVITNIPEGTKVCVYDLCGILYHQTVSTGGDLFVPISSGSVYILKVSSDTVKFQ